MCELCGKTFSERTTLETHKLIHTGKSLSRPSPLFYLTDSFKSVFRFYFSSVLKMQVNCKTQIMHPEKNKAAPNEMLLFIWGLHKLFFHFSGEDMDVSDMRQEVPDRVHVAEARPSNSWEGGGSVVSPMWNQGVHPGLHEPPPAPQTPWSEWWLESSHPPPFYLPAQYELKSPRSQLDEMLLLLCAPRWCLQESMSLMTCRNHQQSIVRPSVLCRYCCHEPGTWLLLSIIAI